MQNGNSTSHKFDDRGEGWVLIQFILLGLILAASVVHISALPTLPDSLTVTALIVGAIIAFAGIALIGAGSLNLGPNLTVFPRPLEHGKLIQTGIYSLVRHPIYSGVLLGALGWSIAWRSLAALLLTLILALYFDRKAAREEIWLSQKYPEYAAYRGRVHKLIPWLY